ncbi:MAG: hypothetical protein ABSC95_19415 [Acetobacteraceae bacterium]
MADTVFLFGVDNTLLNIVPELGRGAELKLAHDSSTNAVVDRRSV